MNDDERRELGKWLNEHLGRSPYIPPGEQAHREFRFMSADDGYRDTINEAYGDNGSWSSSRARHQTSNLADWLRDHGYNVTTHSASWGRPQAEDVYAQARKLDDWPEGDEDTSMYFNWQNAWPDDWGAWGDRYIRTFNMGDGTVKLWRTSDVIDVTSHEKTKGVK